MPAVNLPNGASAILYSRDEISERTVRTISRAFMKAAGTAAKLTQMGLDEKDPTTWGVYADITDDDQANLDGYQAALIVGMVKSWSLGDLPTTDSALDLAKPIFDELSNACANEFNKAVDFGPDINPKAPTAD
jgi:phenylpyruvate tautomerase PptA (4-oxalocrotonate tautomerase family)